MYITLIKGPRDGEEIAILDEVRWKEVFNVPREITTNSLRTSAFLEYRLNEDRKTALFVGYSKTTFGDLK